MKNAPNLKTWIEPIKRNALSIELDMLAGVDAWEYHTKATNAPDTAKQMRLIELQDKGAMTKGLNPIILAGAELANLAGFTIAPAETKIARLWLTNSANTPDETRLALVKRLNECAPMLRGGAFYDVQTGAKLEEFSQYAPALAEAGNALDLGTDEHSPRVEIQFHEGTKSWVHVTPRRDEKDGRVLPPRLQWLSEHFAIVGDGSDGEQVFTVLEYNGKRFLLPREKIGTREGWAILRGRGLSIASRSTAQNALADFIQLQAKRGQRFEIVTRTGWLDDFQAFAMPSGQIIGNQKRNILFNGDTKDAQGYKPRGSWQEWRDKLGALAVGNEAMMLSIGVALGAPLLELLGLDAFGVHWFGDSSRGKSTTTNLAASIYGTPENGAGVISSWNSTAHALENEAYARNGVLMVLDELNEAGSVKGVYRSAYALFNGKGKTQGHKDGGNREAKKWKLTSLSTGETDLEGFLNAGGEKINAGQLVRLLNISMPDVKNYHGFANVKAHADAINATAKTCYGAFGVKWIETLIAKDKTQLRGDFEALRAELLQALPANVEPQHSRVLGDRFSVILFALLTANALLGWDEREIRRAVRAMFEEWRAEYGDGSRKEKQIVNDVRGWLLVNESRLERRNRNEARTGITLEPIRDRAGYRIGDDDFVYIISAVFENEVIKGHTRKLACETLLKAGILREGNDGQPYKRKMPIPPRARCYVLNINLEEQ